MRLHVSVAHSGGEMHALACISLRAFLLFRPPCPTFLFADIDTYVDLK